MGGFGMGKFIEMGVKRSVNNAAQRAGERLQSTQTSVNWYVKRNVTTYQLCASETPKQGLFRFEFFMIVWTYIDVIYLAFVV